MPDVIVMEENKLHHLVCADCGEVFTASNVRKQRCPECNLQRRKESHKQYMEGTKSLQVIEKPKKAKRKTVKAHMVPPIREVVRMTEQYNQAHGTHLSYGQYVLLMRSGKL